MTKWALRAEFESKEKMNAFLRLIQVEKCFHIETDFDVFQNVYKVLVEWED